MSIENFSYYDDVCIEINNKIYTVGDLIEMNDENFNYCYEKYKTDLRVQINENAAKEDNSYSVLVISTSISIMEKIRLERRLNKLEGKHSNL